jgi:adenylate cyclase
VDGLIGARACEASSRGSLAPCLASQLLANADLQELTFTRANPSWQLSLYREKSGAPATCSRYVHPAGGKFVADVQCGARTRSEPALDPTEHPSFSTPAQPEFAGRTLWSDLSYAEMDAQLAPAERRVVVVVLRQVGGGVLRVAELAERIDARIAAAKVNEDDPDDPYRVLLCDDTGRLITRTGPGDHMEELEDDLRVVSPHPAEAIAAALAQPTLHELDEDHPFGAVRFMVGGREYFASYRALDHTQSWRVVVVGPEDYYLKDLRRARRALIAGGTLMVVLFLLAGAWALRAIRGGLARIESETRRMRDFQFSPSRSRAGFRDVTNVLDSLEHAKTALRALGRYVPIDLVRRLYDENREPALGSELRPLTLMFTDIKDFTTLAESLPPDRLARLLGAYLGAMTGAVEEAGGTVDKYIGDAVMAMWNAPLASGDHPARACRAALACAEATRRLFASPEWEGLPPLETRFGLHTAEVMVGHFGSPARLSYTAIGDGVNLAARLEGLNKQYGTSILVSGDVERAARGELEFRRLDRVAVKGKSQAIDVYELLGARDGMDPARLAAARAYERAFASYLERDFAGAIAELERIPADPPSERLLARCRALALAPPPSEWVGVYVASEK